MRYYVTESKLSGVFSETFFLMKKNFVPLLIVNLILGVFSFATTLFSEAATLALSFSATGYYVQSILYSILSLVISCLLLFLISPFVSAFCKVRCFSTMGGTQLSFAQTFRVTKIKFPYALTSSLCLVVLSLILVPVIVLIAIFGAVGEMTSPSSLPIFIIVVSIFVLGVIYLAMHFLLVADIAVNEELHGFKAVFKSFRLVTKGNYRKNAGHLLLFYGIMIAIELLLSFLVIRPLSQAGYVWAALLIALPVTVILTMFSSCYYAVVYKNASLHMEGYTHFPYAVLHEGYTPSQNKGDYQQ